MPTPFDHLDKFKQLSPEVQAKIVDKFNTFDPEKKQAIMSKINTPMQLRASEGITPIEPVTNTAIKGLESYKQNAPQLTEALMETGTNPKLAKVVGDTFAHIPDIAMIAEGAPSLIKGSVSVGKAAIESSLGKAIRYTGEKEAARLAAEKAGLEITEQTTIGGVKSAAERVRGMANKALTEAKQLAQEPITKIKETIKELPILKRKVLEGANAAKLEAKAAIGQAEKEMGIDLATVGTEASDRLIKQPQAFISKFGQIANRMSPEQLAESIDTKSLQVIRKAAERGASAARKLGQDTAEFYRIESHFRQAIAKTNSNFRIAIERFKDASESLKTLPETFKAKAEGLTSGLQKMQSMAQEKVLNDAKVTRLNQVAEILERKAKELPRQYAKQKAKIDLAIQEAKNLAQKQAHTRWLAGGGAAVAGVGLFGRKFVNKVTGD